MIEGRTFTEDDNRAEMHEVVIDRVLAAKLFPGQSAVGRTVLLRVRTPEPERFKVIGVVEHQRHASLARDGREAVFLPEGLVGFGAANRWVVRTSGDPAALSAVGQRASSPRSNPRVGVIDVQPMLAFVGRAQAQTKFALVLIGVFAGIALVLAAVGLYSVLSTTVRQRQAEIGVRMAFGAEHGRIFRMMVVQGLKLSAAGLACGVAAALDPHERHPVAARRRGADRPGDVRRDGGSDSCSSPPSPAASRRSAPPASTRWSPSGTNS